MEVRHAAANDWITLLFLGCLILYTASRYFFPRRFDQFALLPFTNSFFLIQGKDDKPSHPFHVMLFVAQLVSISLFLLLFLNGLDSGAVEFSWPSYLKIITFYGGFALVKYYIEKIVGAAFHLDRLIDDYLLKKLAYRNLLALLIFGINLPLVFLITPDKTVLLVIAGILLILNVSTLIYTYKGYFKTIVSNFFYFILYLCALEIAPYVILYKALEYWGYL